MQEMFRYGLMVLFLGLCTWQDIRTGRISFIVILVFGIIGIGINLMIKCPPVLVFCNMLPGVGILLFGRLSGEQIGYGDGLVMVVAGLFLKGRGAVSLFLTGLFICAAGGMILFMAGKVNRKSSLPFLPFLLAGLGVQIVFVYR